VVETVEMLTLDAVEYAPTLWLVLTAREHLTRRDLNAHLKHVGRVLKRRWPDVEWFVQVEFQRRGALHANLLVKGVPVEQLRELYELVVGEWCARVDAEAGPFDDMRRGGQWAGEIADGVGVVRYLSKMLAHGLKAEQRPPIGWRGHRTSQTRGYLVRPATVMRDEARQALKLKRKLWRGLSLEVAMHELAADAEVVWSLHSSGLGGADPDRARARAARRPFSQAGASPRYRLTQASTAALSAEGNDHELAGPSVSPAEHEAPARVLSTRGGAAAGDPVAEATGRPLRPS
jgi:hypothetical protein